MIIKIKDSYTKKEYKPKTKEEKIWFQGKIFQEKILQVLFGQDRKHRLQGSFKTEKVCH